LNDDLESLKTNPAVMRVYQKYVPLKRDGEKWVGKCCLHQEKSGSFTVHKDLLFYCYGCSAKGNCIQLVQQMENCSFKEAVEKVRQEVGETKWETEKTQVEQVFRSVSDTQKTYKTFTLSEYSRYTENLKNSKEAQAWLEGRGITLETALKLHTGFVMDVGKRAGEKFSHLADKGWLAFPCVDGEVVRSIKFRSIVEKAFCKQGGMATELYNTDTVDPFEDVYLVEGEIDALTLEQTGFHAVSLASASSHPTPSQKDVLMRANRVLLAGDCDGAVGDAIMAKLWLELSERAFRLKWPEGMKDANQTYLEKCKGDLSIFRTEVEQLTSLAAKNPIPDVYDLKEVMISSQQGSLTDHPLRFRWPQPDVDKMAVLLPGSVWGLYATQTGQGKTQLSLQATMHNALHYGARVLNWQCELSPEEISTIVTAQLLKKDRNTLTPEDKKDAAGLLSEATYYVGYNPDISDGMQVLDLIEAAIKRLSITHLVIDTYHNLILTDENETSFAAKLSNRLKALAMKYGLIVGVIFQPRKAQQQTRGKRTHITDVRGAASATDTCDAVYAMHRELAKSEEGVMADDVYESRTLIQAQKTRAKGTGKAETYLQFFGSMASFEQLDYIHEEPR
jgi:hypothetical protein